MHQLLQVVSRLLCLTCRGSAPLRSLIKRVTGFSGTHRHVLDHDDFVNALSNLRDSSDFWKLLQHRVTSRTAHQRSLNDVGGRVFCIFGACRCITTALFYVAAVSARVVERSDSITCGKARSDHGSITQLLSANEQQNHGPPERRS